MDYCDNIQCFDPSTGTYHPLDENIKLKSDVQHFVEDSSHVCDNAHEIQTYVTQEAAVSKDGSYILFEKNSWNYWRRIWVCKRTGKRYFRYYSFGKEALQDYEDHLKDGWIPAPRFVEHFEGNPIVLDYESRLIIRDNFKPFE